MKTVHVFDCPALDYALVLCSELEDYFLFLFSGCDDHKIITTHWRLHVYLSNALDSAFLYAAFLCITFFSSGVIFPLDFFLRISDLWLSWKQCFFFKLTVRLLYKKKKKKRKIWIESDKWTEYLMSRIAQHLWLCFRPPQPTVSFGLRLCWNNPVSTGF